MQRPLPPLTEEELADLLETATDFGFLQARFVTRLIDALRASNDERDRWWKRAMQAARDRDNWKANWETLRDDNERLRSEAEGLGERHIAYAPTFPCPRCEDCTP